MNQPLVSVVIATYNMEQYISDAVSSVLGQTWSNLEVIVIDDGSSDDTESILDKYNDDPRFSYFKFENAGQTVAKNRGIAKSKGEFIAFCDADDLWEANKLEVQMPYFSNDQVGVVYSEVSFIDNTGKRYEKPIVYQRHSGHITGKLLVENFVPFGTAVVRRECFDNDGVFDQQYRMGIDWELWLRLSLNWQFAYAPDKTYIYREWEGQMSNNYHGRYQYAFKILSDFEEKNKSLISKRDLKRAWADNYVSRGMIVAEKENSFVGPVKDILRGILVDPFYVKGWKAIAKVTLNKIV